MGNSAFPSSPSPPCSKNLWWTDVIILPGEKCKCGEMKETFGKWSVFLWICDDLISIDLDNYSLFLAVGVDAALCSHWRLEAGGLASGRQAHNLLQSSSHRLNLSSLLVLISKSWYDHFTCEFLLKSRRKCVEILFWNYSLKSIIILFF